MATLRLEFNEDGKPFKKGGIEFSHSELVFNTNESIKELGLTNVSTGTDPVKYITFLPLKGQGEPFEERVDGQEPPVHKSLDPEEKAVALVYYTSAKKKEARNRVAVNVEGYPNVDIPIMSKKLGLNELNFGRIVVKHKTITGEIWLVNHGSESGDFKLKSEGSKLITFFPASGSVPPNSKQLIKVTLETKQLRPINEKNEVTLGHETKTVYIRATLVESGDMLSQETEDRPSTQENSEEQQETKKEPDRQMQRASERSTCCVIV